MMGAVWVLLALLVGAMAGDAVKSGHYVRAGVCLALMLVAAGNIARLP